VVTSRADGRSHDQLREVRFTRGWLEQAEGSVLVEFGQTRVLVAASVTEGVPRWRKGSGLGWVTSEYAMLPRATPVRTARESTKGKPTGRTQEIQRLIGRSLRSVTQMEELGERTVLIDCDVIEADGGTRTASITGAFVALGLALQKLVEEGILHKLPLRDYVAATSVGVVNGDLLLDLNYEEDSQAQVDMNLVETGGGLLVEVQGTAEGNPFSKADFYQLIALGSQGTRQLVEIQRRLVHL